MANKNGRTPKGPGESNGCRELYQWIKERNLSYTQAGEFLGYPLETISRYVTGARRPDYAAAHKLQMLTGISMDAWAKT